MAGLAASERTVQDALSPGGAVLLSALEFTRDRIARRLVSDSHAITDHDLNYLTVSAFMQILFLKTGQACGFTEPGTLADLAGCNGITQRMGRACSDAGLDPERFFEPGPAGSRALPVVNDEPLRDAIGRLDSAELPDPVAGLPPEDLAAVLDHVVATRLQVGEGYRVARVGKSALLYTGTVDVPPQEVVEQVVTSAVRNGSKNAREEMREIRALDPACGAGLFLLALFRNRVRKKQGRNNRPLTISELLKVLSTSVFGTDIDPESVSAARFVLLLAFIEECRKSGPVVPGPDQIRAACTFLTETIRCGNALIGPDYFSGKPVFPFNAEERRRVNAFDWRAAYPDIMAQGGFDAVIGAPPPYRPFAVKAREEYFQTHYDSYAASAGLYGYFIERSLSLIRPGGTLAFLVPGTFLRSEHARPLRRLLLGRQITRVACTGRTRVLPEGDMPIYLLVLKNEGPRDPFTVSPDCFSGRHDFQLDPRMLDDGGWTLEDTRTEKILLKIRGKGTLLEEYVMGELGTGTHAEQDNPLVVNRVTRNRLTKNAWWARRFFVPLLCPADIRRYVPKKPSRYAITGTGSSRIRKCRALVQYLESGTERRGKESGRSTDDDEQDRAQDHVQEHFLPEKPMRKIIFALHQHSPAFSLDQKGTYAMASTVSAILRNDPYLAAILNSTLGRFIIWHICPYTDRGYHMSPASLGKFPVIVPDFEKFSDKKIYEKIMLLVSQMISLQDYCSRTKTDQERRFVQQEIDATDVRIDALVYELYGLTSEEIAVVEAGSA
ncbi:Eco57I restriction-modification methylase domain-containing protein [Methanoregula formicica]|uniref:site-specific DNA-methyltransferase (adenine-specific) n=1 Tax=Methanoregula formicica (strain DSM 22288 / NBRC 105244 / SMSP) TaxID=593750 RepID=L0HKP6_METFS|nr:restriction endonuclease [Methanoregula formicica]AGB03898.1 Eco57I restriction endonuclease [Methanoregula formicica SMSP]